MSRLAFAGLIGLALCQAAELSVAQEDAKPIAAPKAAAEPAQTADATGDAPSVDEEELKAQTEAVGFLQAIGQLIFGAQQVEMVFDVQEPEPVLGFPAVMEGEDEVDVHAPELAAALFGVPEGGPLVQEVNGGAFLNFDQQMKLQIEPILKAELYFLRMNCKLTPEQYQKLKKASNKVLSDAVAKASAVQQQVMRGAAQQRSMPNFQALFTDALVAAVKESAPEVNVANYVAELEKRKANRKQAAIQVLVFKLDRDLLLTPEQRRQITESLTAKYDAKWEGYLSQNYAFNEDYVGYPPDDRFVSFLTETQKSVLNANKKNAQQDVFFGFDGNFLGGALDPDAFKEPAPK